MLAESELENLLDDLCGRLGLCLKPDDRRRIADRAPWNVNPLINAVLSAEGVDHPSDGLRAQTGAIVAAAFSRAAFRPENIDFFVLDTLANDLESIADILRLINHAEIGWTDVAGRHFTVTDITPALLRLIRDGSVEACYLAEDGRELRGAGEATVPPYPLADLWFRMTPRGRIRHTNWSGLPEE